MKTIDFSGIGDKLTNAIMQDFRFLLAGIEVPEVLMGSGQLNEGIAKVQLEAFQRKIASLQEAVESVIELSIFRPLLLANKLAGEVEFIWNLPGEEEINDRIERITKIMESMTIDENMRRALQLELARLLDISEADKFLPTPDTSLLPPNIVPNGPPGTEAENPERKEEETKIEQPEVPGAKPAQEKVCPVHQIDVNKLEPIIETEDDFMTRTGKMTVEEFVSLPINEIAGFNYGDYTVKILQRVNKDKFKDLAAKNAEEVAEGLLSKEDVEKLRVVLKDGFRENKTIREIENEVNTRISLRDRVSAEGKLIVSAASRPNLITRSETVRLANEGLVDLYKENKIEKVQFLSALSLRTDQDCIDLNGQIFEINELVVGVNQPPIHPNCRCTLLSVQK